MTASTSIDAHPSLAPAFAELAGDVDRLCRICDRADGDPSFWAAADAEIEVAFARCQCLVVTVEQRLVELTGSRTVDEQLRYLHVLRGVRELHDLLGELAEVVVRMRDERTAA